jgi:site-specific DNA recombinase
MQNSLKSITNVNPYEGRIGLVYARVSSKRQEIEGSGLQSQEGRCIADLRSIKVPYEKSFLDSYTGGGDFMNRPAVREMLGHIDKNIHKKYLIDFDDLKRFARDVEFHLKLRAALKARDVLVRCLNYNFDESPEGRYTETILAAGAELERHQNKRQVVQKQKARLEKGYWAFGAKKGYDQVKDEIHGTLSVPLNPYAEILKEALEGFSTGKFLKKIDVSIFLVERGFWKGKNPDKHLDKVDEMLRDCFYAGFIEYPKWEVARREGKHKPIISATTLELNLKRLKREGLSKRVRLDISPDFPLRGLCTCIGCGDPLTAGWTTGRSNKYPLYKCQKKGCVYYGKSIRKKDIEDRFNILLKKQNLKSKVGLIVEKVFVEMAGIEPACKREQKLPYD